MLNNKDKESKLYHILSSHDEARWVSRIMHNCNCPKGFNVKATNLVNPLWQGYKESQQRGPSNYMTGIKELDLGIGIKL